MKSVLKYALLLGLMFAFVNVLVAQEANSKKKKKKKKKGEIELPVVSRELLDSIQNNLVWVTGGKFVMGNSAGEADEKPMHEVIVDGFSMSRYPVTQRQWVAIMGNNPSEFQGCDQCPIDKVSWDDAQQFIKILNLLTGKKYTLPTEAEWEFAAKGGKDGRGYKYSGGDNLDELGWYTGNSGRMPHPVGEKLPNELGLYDMSGNVWEWCQDWYNKNFYELQEKYSPVGPESGAGRVRRGGSWFTQELNCKTSTRNNVKQDYKDDSGGFRLAQYPN
ncbi:MAG TPA: formylglycine-generating enzyme family protein [Agriterribacter sp.]|nr:formylglycine-generating enzyme family protein [Agriterribacter sp.]